MTSYAYCILAGFYLMRGADGWRAGFEEAINTAIVIHQGESPKSTWYKHSKREIAKALVEMSNHDKDLGQPSGAADGEDAAAEP